jgi:hypothetical protein
MSFARKLAAMARRGLAGFSTSSLPAPTIWHGVVPPLRWDATYAADEYMALSQTYSGHPAYERRYAPAL